MSFDELIESLIKEAQARGEFDNLPGKGKRIDLTEYFNAPEDIRLSQTLLKDAGMVPAEVELLREITILKEALNATENSVQAENIRERIREKQLNLSLLLERHKR